MKYEIRDVNSADLKGIVALRKSIEGGNSFFERSERYYQWKYFENPCRLGIAKIAIDTGNKIVGLAAVTFKRFRISEGNHLVAEWGDFFTHPRHRRQGVFSALCETLLQDLEASNAAFSYVRPNKNSFSIVSKKFDFSYLSDLGEAYLFLRPSQIALRKWPKNFLLRIISPFLDFLAHVYHRRLQPSLRTNSVLKITTQQQLDPHIDNLIDSQNQTGNFLIKDQEYLSWRYLRSPIPFDIWIALDGNNATGLIVGTLDSKNNAYLVDLIASNWNSCKSLYGVLASHYKKKGSHLIRTLYDTKQPKESMMRRLLAYFRFIRIGKNLHFLYRQGQLPILGLWDFRLGDIDGI